MHGNKLQSPSPGPPLATFYLQSVQMGNVKMFKSTKVIGVIFQSRTGRHIHGLDSISMVWEYDSAFLERRKGPACYPLDRNRFQMQDAENLGQRKIDGL